MSSLRDRRVRIYDYSDDGAQGFTSAKYTFRQERWAAAVQQRAGKTIPNTAPSHRVDAVFDFDPSVTVESTDLLTDGSDRYFVRGITLQRTPAALLVSAERIDDQVFEQMTLDDPPDLETATYDDSVLES